MRSDPTAAFLRWAFLRSALARGWWLTTALYLVVVADLSPFQLVLIGVFQGLTVIITEVPAGAVADAVGRRPAMVVAHVVMGTGMALAGAVTGFLWLVVSQCLWGLGWAISSGADVAWITDELDRSDLIDRVLTAQGRVELLGTPVGVVGIGALAWAMTLSTAIVAAGVAMIVLGLLVVAPWPESRRPHHSDGRRWTATTANLRRGLVVARNDRAILLVLAGTLLLNGGAEGFGRLFERRLIDLGIPTSPEPIVWFAAVALVAAGLGALTLVWVEGRIAGAGVARRVYVAACAIGSMGLILFAHAPNTGSAVAGSLLVTGLTLPTARIAATILVNRRTTSDTRATVHSLLSQAENLGEIVCGLLLALVASTTSATVTLVGSAVLVAAACATVSRTSDASLRAGSYSSTVSLNPVEFYGSPAAMTALPDHPALAGIPTDLDQLRGVVQGLLIHRDWATAYGVPKERVRIDEQNLRSTTEVLARALEISSEPVTVTRQPIDRVLCICRHFTLLHTAFLRAQGVPARVRCGFGGYFDPTKWYDHWITERWNGRRWVREDPQIDDLQAQAVDLDFDPYDQPPGRFLTGSEAWMAARAGEVDASRFGIFHMWGLAFIAGNVVTDFACLNKVELLPWDSWGMRMEWRPNDAIPDETATILDDIAELVAGDDLDAVRNRYLTDERLRVPDDITSFTNGQLARVHLDL